MPKPLAEESLGPHIPAPPETLPRADIEEKRGARSQADSIHFQACLQRIQDVELILAQTRGTLSKLAMGVEPTGPPGPEFSMAGPPQPSSGMPGPLEKDRSRLPVYVPKAPEYPPDCYKAGVEKANLSESKLPDVEELQRSELRLMASKALMDQVIVETLNVAVEVDLPDFATSQTMTNLASVKDPEVFGATASKTRTIHWTPLVGEYGPRIPILHPECQVRIIWLCVGFCFIVYEAYAVPLYLAFSVNPKGAFLAWVSMINTYFLCDIVVNFLMGYRDREGELVFTPWRIMLRYGAGWFLADVVAGIPWEWIYPDGSQQAGFTRSLRFVRAFRLLRLTRLLRLLRIKDLSDKVDIITEASQGFTAIVGVSRVLFLLFGITHWAACVWYAIGMRNVDDPRDHTWVEYYIGDRWEESQKLQRYVYSFYFTLTTMTTVGYGDMSAQNFEETLFVLVLLLVASVVYAGLTGALTDIIREMKHDSNVKREQKVILSRYMRFRAVPSELFNSIRQHLIFIWDANEGFEVYEEQIKHQLTPNLRTELCYHIYGRILAQAPFFAWLRDYPVCLKELSTKAQSIFLDMGDKLFKAGEPNEQMYILLTGSVKLSSTDSESLRKSEDHLHHDGQHESMADLRIPRHKQAGLTDVGKNFLKNTQQKARLETKKKTADILKVWGVGDIDTDDIAIACDEEALEELRRKERKKRARFGVAETGVGVFDSTILLQAQLKLRRQDTRRKHAAGTMQRCWRKHKGEKPAGGAVPGTTFNTDTSYMTKALIQARTLTQAHHTMKGHTVQAPAYFGESCLWMPIETWNTEALPYRYSARCVERGELMHLSRRSVHEVCTKFDPWLPERFETFRQGVVEGMLKLHVELCGGNPESDATQVDWSTVDVSMPTDDVGMDGRQCKALLRAALPSRQAQSILSRTTGPSAETDLFASIPIRPRVPLAMTDSGPIRPLSGGAPGFGAPMPYGRSGSTSSLGAARR